MFSALALAGPDDETPSRRLRPEDYQRILRAIILTENKFADDGRNTMLWRPMDPEAALMQCGKAQEELAFLLIKQGVSPDDLKLVQTDEMFGKHGLSHAMLVYRTRDREGKTVHMVLDPTFPQFANYTDRELLKDIAFHPSAFLHNSGHGRDILRGVSREGFWIADDAKLAKLNAAFTVDETGKAQMRNRVTVDTIPAASYHARDLARIRARPQKVDDYLFGKSLDESLKAIGPEQIDRRVAVGERAAARLLDNCRGYFAQTAPPDRPLRRPFNNQQSHAEVLPSLDL